MILYESVKLDPILIKRRQTSQYLHKYDIFT